jgi:hypothetical protein
MSANGTPDSIRPELDPLDPLDLEEGEPPLDSTEAKASDGAFTVAMVSALFIVAYAIAMFTQASWPTL